eukprot:356058-Chlamydomonas_euryale.AAC.7
MRLAGQVRVRVRTRGWQPTGQWERRHTLQLRRGHPAPPAAASRFLHTQTHTPTPHTPHDRPPHPGLQQLRDSSVTAALHRQLQGGEAAVAVANLDRSAGGEQHSQKVAVAARRGNVKCGAAAGCGACAMAHSGGARCDTRCGARYGAKCDTRCGARAAGMGGVKERGGGKGDGEPRHEGRTEWVRPARLVREASQSGWVRPANPGG